MGAERVIAFEPDPEMLDRFHLNLKDNGLGGSRRLTLHTKFIGGTDGPDSVSADILADAVVTPCLLKADIQGNPFAMPKDEFDTAVTDAMQGASFAAERLGYRVVQIDDPIVGEAREAAVAYAQQAATRADDLRGSICIVSSGETTVRVTGDGHGGRNQEFVLAAALKLGYVSEADFDRIVDPTKMVHPYVATGR